MAQFEREEYKFPDEVDDEQDKKAEKAEKKADEVEQKQLEIEIEVEDDRPEKDRVEPLPQKIKEELYEDELTDYSAKVKQKLMQMKKLAHDERREKEQSAREAQEAYAIAQKVLEENRKLKQLQSETEKNVLISLQKTLEMEMSQAEKDLKEAHESGDTDKMIAAQKKLTEVSFKSERVKNYRPAPLQQAEPPVQMRQPAIKADPTAVAWQQENSWFGGKDREEKLMTSMALAMHEQLIEEGVRVSSPEYYRRIDETVRQRFPERFGDDTKSERSTPATVVAPATRSTAPKKVRLTASQMRTIKTLGITPEQYVREFLKVSA